MIPGTFDKWRNPYVGPRAFEENEREFFFGREDEIEIMIGLVMARRASLLFSPSGAGKSSLLRAGLIPELTRQEAVRRGGWRRTSQKMRVLPIVNVSSGFVPGLEAEIGNVYVFGTLLSLLPDVEPGELAALTLVEGLAPFFANAEADPGPEDTQQVVALAAMPSTLLIFDQFEELFTWDPTGRPEREGFFEQVGQALAAYPELHVLFAMREDYVAKLIPYAALLPDELRPRYRMEMLGKEAACLAIQQPARQAGVEFTDAAATKLVDDLRSMRVQQPNGTAVEELGPWVEPVQLQVVCRRLWEKLPEGVTQIMPDDVQSEGDVDSALAAYYSERVGAVAAETGVTERSIRRWFDRQLITEQGMRGDVLQGPEQSAGLDNQVLRALVDAHLVRAEKRRGATWFELAHDRLVEPVRANNTAWRVTHLSPLQRQAALWQDEQRADGFLLGGGALTEAEDWAKAHRDQLTEVEREFLDECKKAQRLHTVRRSRILLAGAAILLVAFAALAGFGWDKARDAKNAQLTSESNYWDAKNAVKTAVLAQGTSSARFLTGVAAQQTTEAADKAKATALAEAQEGLSSASTEVARSQALGGTIEALKAANQALPAETAPANLTATAAAGAATAQAIESKLAQVGATQTAMVEATQTAVVQATQTAIARATQTAMVEATITAMAETRYCYKGELTRRENIGPPSISIWGRVLDRNGGGVGGVLVRIENDWGWSHELRTQPKGWFRVDGLTEPIRWTVRLPDYGASVKVQITDYGQRAIVMFAEKPCP
jgi:hypothetical protein